MNTKAFMFVFMCTLTTMFLMLQDYLDFKLSVEELKLKMMPRAPKESETEIVQTKFGHEFKMVYDWKPRNNSTKYALFWGPYVFQNEWKHGDTKMDQDFLKNLYCPETNCVLTHDEKLLPSIMDFDAVIYNCYKENVTFPELRSAHQLYIMTANESPVRIIRDMEQDRNLVNLTMTYRVDSDILFPYAEVIDEVTGQVIAPAMNIKWRQPEDDFKDEKLLEIAKNKTTMASWIVSNCNETKSYRNELVKKLQDLGVEVQIFGSCGNKTLDFDDQEPVKAKFYFAFENSLCTDYITEKAFKYHDKDIIPVIYSGADMNRFMPPKSYIDANLFETAEDLAKHLKFLSNNPDEYIKYFWWKKYYKVRQQNYYVKYEQLCKICKKLHGTTNLYTKTQYYSDVKAWFTEGMCRNATIKF